MKKGDDFSTDAAALRSKAEDKLNVSEVQAHPSMEKSDTLRLIHELQVHQIELEIQNKELRQARLEVEEGLKQYVDLYDFAPVAYFTIDRESNIRQTSFVGAELLGKPRSLLLNRCLHRFISPETRSLFHEFLIRIFDGHTRETCEVILLADGGDKRYVRMDAVISENENECRITAVDITERTQIEEEKYQFYRDTIKSVTQGKLDLVPIEEVKEYLDPAGLILNVDSPADCAIARSRIMEFCSSRGVNDHRYELFELAIGEAITNAIKHADGCRVYAGVSGETIWVAISDTGQGISHSLLPSATLRRGFSSKISMGMGFTIIMDATDNIMLCTGLKGTTVVLSVNLKPSKSAMPMDNFTDTWDEITDV